MNEYGRLPPELNVQDTWAKEIDDLICLSISAHLRNNKIASAEETTQEDRVQLISTFEKSGLINLRGAASHLAGILNLPRVNLYNYRTSVKDKKLTGEAQSTSK